MHAQNNIHTYKQHNTPSNRKVSASFLISSGVIPLPSSSLAVSRMSTKHSMCFFSGDSSLVSPSPASCKRVQFSPLDAWESPYTKIFPLRFPKVKRITSDMAKISTDFFALLEDFKGDIKWICNKKYKKRKRENVKKRYICKICMFFFYQYLCNSKLSYHCRHIPSAFQYANSSITLILQHARCLPRSFLLNPMSGKSKTLSINNFNAIFVISSTST